MRDDVKRPTQGQSYDAAAAQAGDSARVRDRILCELSHYAIIRVSGLDARPFLQGQCTIDVDQIGPGASRLGAFCTPKGRVLALALFFVDDSDVLLRTRRDTAQALVARLSKFILRARVRIGLDGTLRALGLAGRDAGTVLAGISIRPPESLYETVRCDFGWTIRVPGEPPRFELYGSGDSIQHLRDQLPVAVTDSQRWTLFDIAAGVAEVYPASSEAFIPQMLGLERLGAVSFTKGCYTGQEIVARTQYLGTLKRRLARARIAHAACPSPGAIVYSRDGLEGGAAQGQIVSAAAGEGEVCELLAVIQSAALGAPGAGFVTADGLVLEGVRPAGEETSS